MRATLEVVKEDGDNLLYWNGRKMLVAKGARDTVASLSAPCSIEAEVSDEGGAPTVVRVHSVTSKAKKVPIEQLLLERRWRDALLALGREKDVETDARLIAQRARANAGAGNHEAALRDFHALLQVTTNTAEIAKVLASFQGALATSAATRYEKWLTADPTRALGRNPWEGVPFDLWPNSFLLDHLKSAQPAELSTLVELAKQRAPGDPRIAAAQRRREEHAAKAAEDRDARYDQQEGYDLGSVLQAVERTFGVELPERMRRTWAAWPFRATDNLRREFAHAFRKISAELVVPGAGGVKIKEMVRISRELQAKHFASEPRDCVFLPVARDGDAWIGLWLVAPAGTADFPVLRIDDGGPSVLAQSTDEWLG